MTKKSEAVVEPTIEEPVGSDLPESVSVAQLAKEDTEDRTLTVTDRFQKASIVDALLREGQIDEMLILSVIVHCIDEIHINGESVSIAYNQDIQYLERKKEETEDLPSDK